MNEKPSKYGQKGANINRDKILESIRSEVFGMKKAPRGLMCRISLKSQIGSLFT